MEKYFEKWKGKQYPVRVVPIDEDLGYGSPVSVASEELWTAIEQEFYQCNKDAMRIDNEIFCYCDPELINDDAPDKDIEEYIMRLIF